MAANAIFQAGELPGDHELILSNGYNASGELVGRDVRFHGTKEDVESLARLFRGSLGISIVEPKQQPTGNPG